MSVGSPPPPSPSGAGSAGGRLRSHQQDAELLFRTKPIAEIRNVEIATRRQIQDKSEELRQLVGNRYRDLIDSADSIVLMKASCESISANISSIYRGILHSLSSATASNSPKSIDDTKARIYGIACRVKYLVDTPENIWGCLDESMYLESSARYIRAKLVHCSLTSNADSKNVLSDFPLLQHQWQMVETFKAQISQRSRDRLLDLTIELDIDAYGDALAAVAVIDDLDPKQVLTLFLERRKLCISQKLAGCCSNVNATSSDVISVYCQAIKIIQVTIGQVGELFLQVLNDLPLFYKMILESPPASQFFGGIPNPDEEVRLWNLCRSELELKMLLMDRSYISTVCSDWLRNCGKEITNMVNNRYLIDVICNGQDLAVAEKLIRETMDSKVVLEGSLGWLKSVFGSEIELPWKRTHELVLGGESDLWDEIFEEAFVHRMKSIIDKGFDDLSKTVNVISSVQSIAVTPAEPIDFQAYLNRSLNSGGVWFMGPNVKRVSSLMVSKPQQTDEDGFHYCLNAYFGAEVSRIRDAVDSCCEAVLKDLLSFLESPNASLRLKDLAPYLQSKCYESISEILIEIKNELDILNSNLENKHSQDVLVPPPAVLVERSLFIGRLLFAFHKHSKHIPLVLGSPKSWADDSTVAASFKFVTAMESTPTDPGSRRHSSLAASALFGADDSSSPQLQSLNKTTHDLYIKAHNMWASWVSGELAIILSHNLRQDETLSTNVPLKGWEDTIVKQDQSEIKISLPSMPSLYITSLLFHACEEIQRVGGHVLDKLVLQNFASTLLQQIIDIYGDFLSLEEAQGCQVSDKGSLQVLFDLRIVADILSGGESLEVPRTKFSSRRKKDSISRERINALINRLSGKLDPIDWLTYEPYLWENERQSYLRHAVVFGFFVQLNRMYTDTVQKLPTNSESNIMRCSVVPRFKYLPISAPALSSKASSKPSISTSLDHVSSRSSWTSYSNEELSLKVDGDESSGLGMAAPLFKSFMQVGSRFGESTLRLGSILSDGQGRFGDILPAQAAGLLSSFTVARSDS